MWTELLGSINELPVERKSKKNSEVARCSNFDFEKRLSDGRGRPCVLGVFHDNYCRAIRRRDAATVERNGFEGKSILVGLRWDSMVDRKACFDKMTHWDKNV